MSYVTFTVGISTELARKLAKAVKEQETTRNAFVRRALEAALAGESATAVLGAPDEATAASPRAPKAMSDDEALRYFQRAQKERMG